MADAALHVDELYVIAAVGGQQGITPETVAGGVVD